MLPVDGIPTPEDIMAKAPPPERLARGPVVMVECFQQIPCDPCTYACPRQAILPMKDINEIPRVDYEKCNGCGQCIAVCPGLALFVVDLTYSEGEALVKLPYEFLPLPAEGEVVAGVNRAGEEVCSARVVKVVATEKMDKTAVIWLAVPKNMAMEVRHLKVRPRGTTVICRCEDVTLEEIEHLIKVEGVRTLEEIKRLKRCGMGPCQGRTCLPLIARELHRLCGTEPGSLAWPTHRPPVIPLKLGVLAGGGSDDAQA